MSARTKGQWLQDGCTVYALNDRGVNWFSASVQDAHTPEAELIEVAQLMKSAPDLLAELQNIANADPSKWDEETRDQFQQWAQGRARAAIAQARGQS